MKKFKEMMRNFLKPSLDKDDMVWLFGYVMNDELDKLKILLESRARNLEKTSKIFENACFYNRLDIVKYLLTSEKTKDFHKKHLDKKEWMKKECHEVHVDIIKYALSLPEFTKDVDMKEMIDTGLSASYPGPKLKFIKLFMTEQFRPYIDVEEQVLSSIYSFNLDILNYLIFDLKVDKTKNLSQKIDNIIALDEMPGLHVKEISSTALTAKSMFNARDLHQELNEKLTITGRVEVPTKRPKL